MSIAIQTKNLKRVYQTYKKQEGLVNSLKGFWNRENIDKVAIENINLNISSGQIIGLVGANGAGKTTLLKLLSGLIVPSEGEALVLGYNPWERKNEFLRQISILLGQKNQLWWDISPSDSYSLLAKIYDLEKNKTKQKVKDLAHILDCTHVLDTQLRRLSLGERMKMEIIGALIHDPKILFLDEPTIGLDIIAQTSIREFLATYVKTHQPTVILTSHYMDDISKLADRLLLISKGKIFYDGTVDEFSKKTVSKKHLQLVYESPIGESYHIVNELYLTAGTNIQNFSVTQDELSTVLQKISSYGKIQDLKIEETDFEDNIKNFMQQEGR